MRTLVAAAVVLVTGTVVAQDAPKPKVEALAWMAGSWSGPLDGGVFEEHWTKPAGGTMVGMGRHVSDGKTTLVEFLKLVDSKDGVVLWVTVEGQEAVPFTQTTSAAEEAVFENLKHDFPKRIIYRKQKDGALFARVENDEKHGKDFVLRPPVPEKPRVKFEDLVVGSGDEAREGSRITVHYTGWLIDGTKFDSSVDRGQKFTTELSKRRLIAGWIEGIAGMKVGGKRKITIPPELGYGSQPNGSIPANSTLVFEVELFEVK